MLISLTFANLALIQSFHHHYLKSSAFTTTIMPVGSRFTAVSVLTEAWGSEELMRQLETRTYADMSHNLMRSCVFVCFYPSVVD